MRETGLGMLLFFDNTGQTFVEELVKDGPADVEASIMIGDQVYINVSHDPYTFVT